MFSDVQAIAVGFCSWFASGDDAGCSVLDGVDGVGLLEVTERAFLFALADLALVVVFGASLLLPVEEPAFLACCVDTLDFMPTAVCSAVCLASASGV
jgi:hypothetical protein